MAKDLTVDLYLRYATLLCIPLLMQVLLLYLSDIHKRPIIEPPSFNLFHTKVDAAPANQKPSLEEIMAQPRPSQEEYEIMFSAYANYYGIDRGLLRTIAFCESRFNPTATNGRHAGLYQFNPLTWQATRERMSLDPDINLRFDPEESIKTAAFKIHNGGVNAWVYCSQRYFATS